MSRTFKVDNKEYFLYWIKPKMKKFCRFGNKNSFEQSNYLSGRSSICKNTLKKSIKMYQNKAARLFLKQSLINEYKNGQDI